MANPKKGRWAMISDGNPELLTRFFRGCREQGIETQGVVINCPPGEFDWPERWKPHTGGPVSKHGDEWFGLLWADQCPQSTKWDIEMVGAAMPWNVVTSSDAMDGNWKNGAVVWGAEYAREVGSILEATEHLHWWSIVARDTGCWSISNTRIPRMNPDETVGPKADNDNVVVGNLIPRFRKAMEKHGVVNISIPDYSGMSILISTPSISKPAVEYTTSLMVTMQDLSMRGARVKWSIERWNADIVMARSHIVAEFLRTDCTHLLMVDDDMSWDMSAIHRMFHAKRDIVAVAGCKKAYPLRCAVSKTDAGGLPIPIRFDPANSPDDIYGIEVDFVGCAFMLVTRKAIERMVSAYPETRYIGVDGNEAHALFLQTIENGTYRPEDFSFCSRWRKIGGKIYILPDVAIGHIGQHEYRGSLMETGGKA